MTGLKLDDHQLGVKTLVCTRVNELISEFNSEGFKVGWASEFEGIEEWDREKFADDWFTFVEVKLRQMSDDPEIYVDCTLDNGGEEVPECGVDVMQAEILVHAMMEVLQDHFEKFLETYEPTLKLDS